MLIIFVTEKQTDKPSLRTEYQDYHTTLAELQPQHLVKINIIQPLDPQLQINTIGFTARPTVPSVTAVLPPRPLHRVLPARPVNMWFHKGDCWLACIRGQTAGVEGRLQAAKITRNGQSFKDRRRINI